ncbi:nicotinate-nucleotide diphosphorylase [Karstenula rhodostoma CBS 690.94]|uniref:Nicotinate-nucleotide pyrophosphorylase [carboxylating] n=1 Tax=Karstenula rhodostoma CBS 690.94 TaxID=1392251 RepID=A0A9P4PF82_9PLEO|nr:nicotinate-nucleotide diphosphorylase [Karstenula rhodostoma CBS 690.94]
MSEGAPSHGAVAHLLPQTYKRQVAEWLEEDTPSFDYGGFVVGEEISEAKLLGKSEVRLLLLGERVALNTLARCSGIATKSNRLLRMLREAGYPNILAGTRKTTPGFRLVEKYGMLVGGVDAHRVDLSAMTMLKDNHIVAAGSITNAVRAAKSAGGFAIKVEVECQSYEEADEAIAAGADIVMLDNFTSDGVKAAAAQLKEKWGKGTGERKTFLVEVSGGLTEENVTPYVCADVDIVSTSSIHQGVTHVDFSLKIVPKGKDTEKTSGESLEMTFQINTERLLDVYYENYWAAYPFPLPMRHLNQRRLNNNHGMENLLLVLQYVGSIFAPWTQSELHYEVAEKALGPENLPRTPWNVQALMILATAQLHTDRMRESRRSLDTATSIALELCMNTKEFAVVYGEGSPVLEESWRRTYHFLVLTDQHFSIIVNNPMCALMDVPNLADLPCDDEFYESGNIPPPRTLQQYDTREFDDVEVMYSSMTYLTDISRITRYIMKSFIETGVFNTAFVTGVDAKIAVWQSLLPASKRDPMRQDGSIDEVMFLTHLMASILTMASHRPFSSLEYSFEELTTISFSPSVPFMDAPKQIRPVHTARTLKACDIQTKLLAIPCAFEKHNVMTGCIVASIAAAQIAACKLLEDHALSIARDRVRLSIGYLNAMGTFWSTSATMAKEVRFVARSALTGLPSTIVSQSEPTGEIEISRDELIWPVDPSAQIDIYTGMSIPLILDAQAMSYASSSTSSL